MKQMKRIIGIFLLIWILAFIAAQAESGDKGTALLRAQCFDQTHASGLQKGGNDELQVFVRTKNPGILNRFGIDTRMRAGEFVTAIVPASLIDSLIACPEVISISTGVRCFPKLDQSGVDVRVDQIHQGNLGTSYTGEGVIVGIYDSGIDWTHPDFITNSGESRVLYLWDQEDDSGTPPAGFTSGSELSREQITRILQGQSPEIRTGIDYTGHGTHIAGIAAGNGSLYTGMAPDADLIIVKGPDSGFSSFNVIEGLGYILSKAEEYGGPAQPVVVNFSLGTHYGPHDGTSDFEQNVRALLEEYDRMLVVAAGNERELAIHATVPVSEQPQSNPLALQLEVGTTRPGVEDYVWIDGWYAGSAIVSISVVTPSGTVVGPVYTSFPVKEVETSEGTVYIDHASEGTDSRNGDNEVLIRLSDTQSNGRFQDNLAPGMWTIRLNGQETRFDAWIYESSISAAFNSYQDVGTMIGEPGNCLYCMTVASYVTRDEWPSALANPWSPRQIEAGSLSHFSNRGPARPNSDNPVATWKPEISAPGEYILSAMSSFVPFETYPTGDYLTEDSLYMAREGTSFAAPHAAGIIALMLEANPELSISQIRGSIRSAARRDGYTGDSWSADWGYGKIDAMNALGSVAVEDLETERIPKSFSIGQNFPNPFNGNTSFEINMPRRTLAAASDLEVTIADCLGRIVHRSTIYHPQNNRLTFSWDGRNQSGVEVNSGIYVAYVRMGRETASVKMILLK